MRKATERYRRPPITTDQELLKKIPVDVTRRRRTGAEQNRIYARLMNTDYLSSFGPLMICG